MYPNLKLLQEDCAGQIQESIIAEHMLVILQIILVSATNQLSKY